MFRIFVEATAAVAIACCFVANSASAQSNPHLYIPSRQHYSEIIDNGDAPVPGATVTITGPDIGTVIAVTDDRGWVGFDSQVCGRWLNNRAENSHQPFRRRERAMAKFRDVKTLQKFAAAHASIYNHFNQDRNLSRRDIFKRNRAAALAEWRQLAA